MNRGGSVSSVDKNAGFTIVETLIVLAVTSALMVAFMITMGGKQARTEFAVGSRQLLRTFQSQIGQISSGYYTKTSSKNCTVAGATIVFSGSKPDVGDSAGCVYLGKAFALGGSDAEQNTVRSYVVAGLRSPGSPSDIKSYSPTAPDANETIALPLGFSLEKGTIRYQDGAVYTWDKTKNRAFWVLRDVSTVSTAGASIQPLAVYATDAATYNAWSDPVVDKINAAKSSLVQPKSVQLCFMGSTSKFVELTIGSQGGAAVTSVVKDACS